MKSFIIALGVLLFIGCGDSQSGSSTSAKNKGGVNVKITKQMGDMMSDTLSYLPLIGNLARSKDASEKENEFLVIGKGIERGDNLSVRKLSKLVYQHGDVVKRLTLAIPNNDKYQSIDVKNFEDFATRYGSIKFQLENWYNHFAGLGNCRFLRWEMIN